MFLPVGNVPVGASLAGPAVGQALLLRCVTGTVLGCISLVVLLVTAVLLEIVGARCLWTTFIGSIVGVVLAVLMCLALCAGFGSAGLPGADPFMNVAFVIAPIVGGISFVFLIVTAVLLERRPRN